MCKSVIQMLEKQKSSASGGLLVLLERLQSRPIHVENARREPTSVMSFSILQDFSVSALLTWLLSKKQHLWHMHFPNFGNLCEVWFYWLRRFSWGSFVVFSLPQPPTPHNDEKMMWDTLLCFFFRARDPSNSTLNHSLIFPQKGGI